MREQPTPCINASRAQVVRGLHMTFEDSRVCASCSAGAPLLEASASGSRRLLDGATTPASSARVTEMDALPGDAGTFGEGFLSEAASPGEQVQRRLCTAAPPKPVPHAGPAHRLRGQQLVNPSHGTAAHPHE